MKIACILIAFIAFLAVPAMAGEIWGIIRQDGKPQEGLTVEVFRSRDGKSSESKLIKTTKTDQWGIYTVFLNERGEYRLRVPYDKDVKPYKRLVGSYKSPVRCDVHLLPSPKK